MAEADRDYWLDVTIFESPDEAHWYERWRAIDASVRDADRIEDYIDLACRGGASSDRLAWVFMSGYQAALSCCFPEFSGPGWGCLAAAEPRDGQPVELIAVEERLLLRGIKSWIAGAEHVDRLIVSIEERRRFVCVDRRAEGVTITLPRSPSFLAELSQGAAAFDDVSVSSDQLLEDPERARWFRGAEPLFVLTALNGFLAAQAGRMGRGEGIFETAAEALDVACTLVDQLGNRAAIKEGLDVLREHTRIVVDEFTALILPEAEAVLKASWQADGGLLKMFGVSEQA